MVTIESQLRRKFLDQPSHAFHFELFSVESLKR
uniref:Uncharacterized protein n=1 Tax=Arundo donax TaxID=35708 RepID=A0A0A9F8P7_ARUDO